MKQLDTSFPQLELLQLPNEILHLIFEHVSTEELLLFAVQCRRLHRLTIPLYFTRNGLPEQPSLLYDGTLNALPGLILSLSTTSLENIAATLVYDLDNCRLTRRLTRLVSKLSRIGEMSISIGFARLQWLDWRDFSTRPSDWHLLFIDLLKAIFSTSCECFTVRGSDRISLQARWEVSSVQTPQKRNQLTQFAGVLYGYLSQWRVIRNDESKACRQLRDVFIGWAMLIRHPLADWTRTILKTSSIRSLTLDLWDISSGEYSDFIVKLHIPHLSHLSISGHLKPKVLWAFIIRHRHVKDLTLRLPHISACILIGVVPRLEKININAQLAEFFLNPYTIGYPHLRHLTICTSHDPPLHNFTPFDSALSRIAQRVGPFELKLQLSGLYSYTWMDEYSSKKDANVLVCVNSLTLCLPRTPVTIGLFLESLPKWLAFAFPRLQRVALEIPKDPDSELCLVFIRSLSALSPLIKSIAINVEERSVAEWLT